MNEKCVEIPVRVVRMLFIDGYFAAFYAYVQQGMTHVAAYNMVEDELTRHHLPGRNANYESFKRAKSHYMADSGPNIYFF